MLTSAGLHVAAVAELARRGRIDPKTTAGLLRLLPAITANPLLEDAALTASRHLMEEATRVALSTLDNLPLEELLGNDVTLFYLLVALLEIPVAEERHRMRGVDASVSHATWADLGVWCHHLRKREGRLGITLETLAWAQRALKGRLFRIGSLQFELDEFTGPLRAYRHRTTGELALVAQPGVRFSHCGRSIAVEPGPGAWIAVGTLGPGLVKGHRIEGTHGVVTDDVVSLSPDEWELALGADDVMLVVHIPAGTRLTLEDFRRSLRDALALFARLEPDRVIKGAFGEGWLFDPQVRALLPNPTIIDTVCAACSLYPSRISEENTVRRLFGPSASRSSVLSMPREKLSGIQRAIAEFLSVPENTLCARGAFMLMNELQAHLA